MHVPNASKLRSHKGTYKDLGDDEGDVGAAEQGVDGAGEREYGADMVEEQREVELERVVAGEDAGGGGGGVVGREAEEAPVDGELPVQRRDGAGRRLQRHGRPGAWGEESTGGPEVAAGNRAPRRMGNFPWRAG